MLVKMHLMELCCIFFAVKEALQTYFDMVTPQKTIENNPIKYLIPTN
jgi:hypothetical protein